MRPGQETSSVSWQSHVGSTQLVNDGDRLSMQELAVAYGVSYKPECPVNFNLVAARGARPCAFINDGGSAMYACPGQHRRFPIVTLYPAA